MTRTKTAGQGRRVLPPEPLNVSGGPAPGGAFFHPKNLPCDCAQHQRFPSPEDIILMEIRPSARLAG